MTKRAAYAVTVLITAVVILGAPVRPAAQSSNDHGKVEEAVEQTDRVIEQAHEIVYESRSQRARTVLAAAEEMQRQAKDQLRGSALQFALKYTLEARNKANQAIGIARNETLVEETLKRVAEETIERIIRVRDMIIEFDLHAERQLKLIGEARRMLEQARANSQELRPQLALRLAETARDQTITAERQVRRLRALKETVERRMVVLERLMERARMRIIESKNEHAAQQLRMAEEHLEQSRLLLAEGKYAAARINLEKSETILRSLIRQMPPRRSSDIEALLEQGYQLLERAQDLVSTRGDTDAGRSGAMLENARRHLEQAAEAAADGREAEARRQIEQARNILREASRDDDGAPPNVRASSLLARLEALHEETLALMEGCESQGAGALFERAVERSELANRLMAEQRYGEAEAEAKIAINLYNRVRELCAF
jgi:hypothetical protein